MIDCLIVQSLYFALQIRVYLWGMLLSNGARMVIITEIGIVSLLAQIKIIMLLMM